VKIYEFSVSGKKGNHGSSGYYFAESGEYTQWVSGSAQDERSLCLTHSVSVFARRFALAQTIGRVLVNLGIAKDPEPTTFTKEEVEKYYGGVSL
jgi:hypothetical protein